MTITVTHSTPADGTFSATGAAAWDATHSFTGILDVANGGTGAATVTGVLKGNGTSAFSAATAGTDYSAGTAALATGIVKSTTTTGALSIAVSGTDYAPATSGSSILYGNGSGGFSSVTVGSGLTFSTGTLSATGGGSGTVTSVSWTGGIVSVGNPTTTPAFTIAGTSGGIPYFSNGTTWASSAALAANALVIGGGAGAAPATTTTGTGILAFLGTPSSANLAAAVTDETGSGSLVFGTSPTLTNPTITNYTETRYSATVTGNAITLDLANGTFQTITTMVGANAITLPAVASGKSLTVQILYASTPTTLTFATPSGSLKYPNGSTPTPTLTNGKYDFYTFVSDGTNWYGVQTGNNF